MVTCAYCKAPNHAIEDYPVLLMKIQEKQQSQNLQLIGVEQRTTDPTINVLTCSGLVTGGQPAKLREEWVWKAEDKQPAVDLDKIKETFMHTHTGFCIPDPPSAKGKELQILNRNMELRSDRNASTSTAMCQETKSTSKVKSFLQSCLKLIYDKNAQLEV